MRGDRPLMTAAKGSLNPATPHARGSTPAKGGDTFDDLGYPACAGIDLHKDSFLIRQCRLPRMRGDRPGNAQLLMS